MRIPRRDLALAALLFGSAQYEVWVAPVLGERPGSPVPTALLLGLVHLPLALRRVRPVPVFALVMVACLLQVKVAQQAWLVPSHEGMTQTWFALLVAFYSVAAHAPPRRAAIAALAGGALFVANEAWQVLSGVTPLDDTLPAWFILGGAWGLGYALRGRQAQVEALADRNARLEREREVEAMAAAAEERARIARELHDVVAHNLSVMVVQAQAAERVLEGEQTSAREALASIDATGRQALVEMRRLVGLLREEGEGGLEPQPGLSQLDELLDQVRDAGLPVEVKIEGRPRPLSPGLDLAAYRIVQEALTNALKHAGPAAVRLTVRFGERDVEVEVVDDGRGPLEQSSGGHGLAGMRERVAVYGGVLQSGSVNGKGFRVHARLPG